jgi:L-aminopeptidase/D-esterase-like protein
VRQAHAVLLAGGSAFGLAAADGVMRYLQEHQVGYDTGVAHVPIVPAAILFDLAVGDASVYPNADMGYAACQAASDGPVAEGSVGAGTGATVGKVLGMGHCMKGGLGTASAGLGGRLVVAALMVVNALGDVVDPQTGQIIAGTRRAIGKGFANSLALMRSAIGKKALSQANTVIGVVATNAALDLAEVSFVASMAHDGIARSVRPAHTLFDGDAIFALAAGKVEADANLVGAYAAEVVAEAIVRGVRAAQGIPGIPAAGAVT